MLSCGAFLLACVEDERPPLAHPGTTTVVTTRPAPSSSPAPVQAASPSIVNNVVDTPPSTVNVAPNAFGATESQPDERTRAMEMVAVASQQIDQLQRMLSFSSNTHRDDIDASVSELKSKRERVLQELRELEMRRAGRSADIEMHLAIDTSNLQSAVRASQLVAHPPSQGLPQPSPLHPSQLP
jgi:hypothetical protein